MDCKRQEAPYLPLLPRRRLHHQLLSFIVFIAVFTESFNLTFDCEGFAIITIVVVEGVDLLLPC